MQTPATTDTQIDMGAQYTFIQYVSGNKPVYIFVQHTDNEDFCDILYDYVVLLNEEYGRGKNIHMFPTPMKAATVADFSQDVPTYIVSGKLDYYDEEEIVQKMLRTWVKEARKE